MIKFYHYGPCGTCKKAIKWLTEQQIPFQAIDIVESPPSIKELQTALSQGQLALAKLFNTSGQSYRQGNFKEKLKTMSESDALTALHADGKLIKRPFLISKNRTLVGFDLSQYEEVLA